MASWCDGIHFTDSVHLLDPGHLPVDAPPGFGTSLYPGQRVLLKAMLDLEERGCVELPYGNIAHTSTAVVAERFSFGKTVVSIALISSSRCPRVRPHLAPGICAYAHPRSSLRRVKDAIGNSFLLPKITVEWAHVITATAVLVGASVLSQWLAHISKLTPWLKVMVIENVKTLRVFEASFRAGGLSGVDIVLIKAGKVTSGFVVEGEPKPSNSNRSRVISRAVATIIEGAAFARLIVDDFDTIDLCCDDCFIPAQFTWLLSATRRRTRPFYPIEASSSPSGFFMRPAMLLCGATDDILNTVFALRCDETWFPISSEYSVDYFRIRLAPSPASRILAGIVDDKIIEMLEAGAVNEAAAALGIVATTTDDIVTMVSASVMDQLRMASTAVERIKKALGISPESTPAEPSATAAGPPAATEPSAAADLGMLNALEFVKTSTARSSLAAMLPRWIKRQDVALAPLRRLRDNIDQEYCQCCKVPFEPDDSIYILTKCCQLVVCGFCVVQPGRGGLIGRCPNCAAEATGVICVGAGLRLEPSVVLPPRPDPRVQAIADLVEGRVPESSTVSAPFTDAIPSGPTSSPPVGPKKILVFSGYPEITACILAGLISLGVGVTELGGPRASRDAAIGRLRDDPATSVLLVTASRDCAGLDLPFLTHVVFSHGVRDPDVISQVIARGARAGRVCSLGVWLMEPALP